MAVEKNGVTAVESDGAISRKSVKKLHFGVSWEEKEDAVMEITRIAAEGGHLWRKALADLGVIPCLVSMLDSDDQRRRRLIFRALVELTNGTYSNKILMMEAGVLVKLKTTNKDESKTPDEFLHLLLSISSLDITTNLSSGEILLPFLSDLLTSTTTTTDVKLISLIALCNLSTKLRYIKPIVSNGLIPVLLNLLLCDKLSALSKRALSVLGNIVVTETGRRAITASPIVPECFVKIMRWEDQFSCQEIAAFILIFLGQKSLDQRTKMAASGVVPALMEVTLLGSELAKRRALKLLEWFRDNRVGREKRREHDFKDMVKLSLHKNMEIIQSRGKYRT